eukprot:CAMPEP_0197523392 /NCGR_PEP_ID=MMETSP1318-20131121/8332_1 /TAXON_ID=552666 /ORGANISM="Partenskyella glossopodia, Strain RCC365" /LENGTH=265 /DNA_ID=CAMNT_0043076069 /DNA_START=128 /DNA_END=925 /DNA_ORIENTATION=+
MATGRTALLLLLLVVHAACLSGAADAPDPAEPVCNIERRHRLSESEFVSEYQGIKPLVVTDINDNIDFAKELALASLKEKHGSEVVILSTSNTFSYDKVEMRFDDYIDSVVSKPHTVHKSANESLYMFGDNYQPWLEELLLGYDRVPFGENQALSFGIGAHLSGVPFHMHGPGFSEVLSGSKRWFLYPRGMVPEFDPEKTTLNWFYERYEEQREKGHLYECVISPGEVLYFPYGWYHATLNIGAETVFISTFTQEHEEHISGGAV